MPDRTAWLGGPWLCRVRVRPGLVAVVVPSLFRRMRENRLAYR